MSGRKALSGAEILAADDLKREWVDVPEWGGGVYVRSMPGLALDRYEQGMLSRRTVEKDKDGKEKAVKVNLENVRAELVVLAACDEKGEPLFTTEQVEALGKKSGAALNRVVAAAQRLNGMSQRDLEQLAKN